MFRSNRQLSGDEFADTTLRVYLLDILIVEMIRVRTIKFAYDERGLQRTSIEYTLLHSDRRINCSGVDYDGNHGLNSSRFESQGFFQLGDIFSIDLGEICKAGRSRLSFVSVSQ